jgi:acyl-CoA reductase-like NAD-dependent aldehyde dehydrogenase
MVAGALTPEEARVLGCLMEKSVTTPDAYPLSLNALLAACNQSTNRDPVVRYDEATIERALERLRELELSRRVRGAGQRVVKHRHVADEGLGINQAELAVLGVLLLRGPQTPGELKSRTERWHRFGALEHVEQALVGLAGRGLAERQDRLPGQKEARWVERLTATDVSGTTESREPAPASVDDGAADGATTSAGMRPATGAPLQHSLEIRNPATGAVVRSVAVTENGEIDRKLARARRAQPAWAAQPYATRSAVLLAFADLLAAEAEECAQLTTRELGKPIRQSRNEIRAVGERILWNVDHAEQVVASRTVTEDDGLVERVTYEPVGVVAHVSAWNYPYFVGLNSIVPALLTGNAVLYKPSEHATLTGLRLVDLLHRAGVPVDVVQAVVGGRPTGAALVASPVDMICFTGSYATGRRVALVAAERLVRVQLELGGKDAAYVCDDVDAEAAAVAVAEGAFYNCGQSCSATERVYVHEGVWDRFVAAFVEVAQSYTVGDPADERTDVGPLTRAEQIGVLEAQIADAVARGARVLCGGTRLDPPGNWFAPTVLVDADERMTVMREESFGPVIGLQRVGSDDEAVARMADTDYGLGAAVFCADEGRATRILERLDVGNAYWNTADRSCVRLPWAGRRHSGLGVSMSEAGVRSFVREKSWHLVARA